MLAKLVELYAIQGKDIRGFFGKPLSYFDFDAILKGIHREETNYYGSDQELSFSEYIKGGNK